jgi:type IV secretion system protein TrbL
MATAARGAGVQRARDAMRSLGIGEAVERGQNAAWRAMTGTGGSAAAASAAAGEAGADAAPAWARQLRAEQTSRHRRQLAVHAIRDGDKGGAGVTPDIRERD